MDMYESKGYSDNLSGNILTNSSIYFGGLAIALSVVHKSHVKICHQSLTALEIAVFISGKGRKIN